MFQNVSIEAWGKIEAYITARSGVVKVKGVEIKEGAVTSGVDRSYQRLEGGEDELKVFRAPR